MPRLIWVLTGCTSFCWFCCALAHFNIVHHLENYMSMRMTKSTKWPMCPAKTQISLGIRPVWSESSLCTQWAAKDPRFLHADSEGSDQTGRMPRLIWVFAGCTSFCWFCHSAAQLSMFLTIPIDLVHIWSFYVNLEVLPACKDPNSTLPSTYTNISCIPDLKFPITDGGKKMLSYT